MNKQPFLQVEQLEKTYGKIRAVNGISFSVEKGESVGIVGESGSGKSESGCDRGRGKRLLHHDRNPLCVNALPGT